jgi:uncharacterized membrane protein YfcA
MSQPLEVWWVLPASICIATVALSSGISGALFFSPFFLLVVGLQPAQAIGAGLPEITTTQLMLRCHIPPRVAVATAIFVLTVTVFFAAGVHALSAEPAWHVVVWSITGVIIGAQIGPRLQGIVPPDIAERVLAALFLAIGILVMAVEIIG